MAQVVYSDGSNSVVAEAATNSVDLPAYTLSGSQCTTEGEGLLFVEGSSCLPLATSDVCVLQLVDSEPPSEAPSLQLVDSEPPSEALSVVPTSPDTSLAPTEVDESLAPTGAEDSVAPSGLDDSLAPSTMEVEISASPTGDMISILPSDVPSIPPSISLEPSFLSTKPPTYRLGCPDGDDDGDDDDDGKGKGGRRGKRGKRDSICRKNRFERKKLQKVFGSRKKAGKSSKQDFKTDKSSKSDKSSTRSDDDSGKDRLIPANVLKGPSKNVIRHWNP